MSEIQRFTQDLNESKELQEEIKGFGNDLGKIVAYANSKGYEFTVADVENLAQQSEELSDEDLDQVAGGRTTTPLSWNCGGVGNKQPKWLIFG